MDDDDKVMEVEKEEEEEKVVDPLLALPLEEYANTVDPSQDAELLKRCKDPEKRRQQRLEDLKRAFGESKPESSALEVPSRLGLISDRSSGKPFRRADGTVVTTGSRLSSNKLWDKRGWTSHDDIRREALAYHELLLATQGILDPDGSGQVILPDPANPKHTKAYAEQRNVSFFSVRDIETEPAPGYTLEQSIGRYVATDMFFVDPVQHMPEQITSAEKDLERKKRGETPLVEIGPRIPVDSAVYTATEKEFIADVERMLVLLPLTNVPVTTPRLLSLMLRIPLPVVMDSFSIFRRYIVLMRVMGAVWTFDRNPENSYIDSETDIAVMMKRLSMCDDMWIKSIESASPGASTKQWKRRKDRKKKGARALERTKSFDAWTAWFPDWFRNALVTARDAKRWFSREFAERKGVRLSPAQLEETMARFAWNQYQLRSKYLSAEFSRRIDELAAQYAAGRAGPEPAVAEHSGFLGDLLNMVYWMTAESIRNKEILLLRWNARYIPLSYWEWLMTPVARPQEDMVTEYYHVPATVYRKHTEAIRAYALRADDSEFQRISAEASLDQVMAKEGAEQLDASTRSPYDGVSLLSVSRLYEFISWTSEGKSSVETVSKRICDALGMVERMPEVRPFEYEPRRDVIRGLVEKLDSSKVPNCMRPSFMESDVGRECAFDEPADSGENVRKKSDEKPAAADKAKRHHTDYSDAQESILVEEEDDDGGGE